jgi:hypothetical protein
MPAILITRIAFAVKNKVQKLFDLEYARALKGGQEFKAKKSFQIAQKSDLRR